VSQADRKRELAFAAWMLAWVAVAIERREVGWFALGGTLGLAARIAAAAGAWTPSGRFGLANALTVVRLAGVASLGALFGLLPRLGFVALLIALFALDGVDGWLARSRGEASTFGAAFDMETDALSVMVLALLLWQNRIVPAWVLVAGLWRYVYAALIALSPSLGEAPRSRFARWAFCGLMLSFSGAFLPVPRLAPPLAAIGTTLVSISFLRSLAQSRARWSNRD
jgi:phosphatidylglycerophosphate synthase